MDKKTTELQHGSGQQMFKVIPSAPQEELVTGMNPQPLTITGVSSSSDGPARMLNLEQSFAPGGATLAVRRRVAQGQSYFRGHGIDIGGGHDCIDRYAALLGFATCRNWDRPDGDAQYLAGVADDSYDFLHSSHCLEHMVTPAVALGRKSVFVLIAAVSPVPPDFTTAKLSPVCTTFVVSANRSWNT